MGSSNPHKARLPVATRFDVLNLNPTFWQLRQLWPLQGSGCCHYHNPCLQEFGRSRRTSTRRALLSVGARLRLPTMPEPVSLQRRAAGAERIKPCRGYPFSNWRQRRYYDDREGDFSEFGDHRRLHTLADRPATVYGFRSTRSQPETSAHERAATSENEQGRNANAGAW